MILTQNQRRVTQDRVDRFREAVAARAPEPGDVIATAERDAMASVAEELAAEIRRYDEVLAGKVATHSGKGVASLPDAVCAARLASGMSRDDVAARLGVPAAEYGRWEDGGFQEAPFHRLMEVVDLLGASVTVSASFPARAAPAP